MAELVYIVDDEPNICKLAALGLQRAGYDTREFTDSGEFLKAVKAQTPDAVVLDWMMPQPDGMELLRILRASPVTRPVAVIMLTARSEEFDRVLGLEMGADDYLAKPFSVKELAARLKAVLRRNEYLSAPVEEELVAGPLRLNTARRRVTRNGEVIELTMKEFDLLCMLMRHRGIVMTRDMLLDRVWGMDYYGDARTVDVHIRYLRQKIEEEPDHPRFIQTLRGVGYRFADEEDLK